MKTYIRYFFKFITLALLIVVSPLSISQTAQRIVVGFAPGGTADVTARLVAHSLAAIVGSPFVVENTPGAGGLIAIEKIKNGGTYGLLSNGMLLNARSQNRIDLIEQLKGVSLIGIGGNAIVVGNSGAIQNISDLIRVGKTRALSVGTTGENTPTHTCIQQLAQSAGFQTPNFVHSNKGFGSIFEAIEKGDVDIACLGSGFVKAIGARIRPIAVTRQTPDPLLPNVPTLESLGIQGVPIGEWYALVTSRNAAPRLSEQTLISALRQTLADPALKSRFEEFGIELIPAGDAGPEIADAFLRRRISLP